MLSNIIWYYFFLIKIEQLFFFLLKKELIFTAQFFVRYPYQDNFL